MQHGVSKQGGEDGLFQLDTNNMGPLEACRWDTHAKTAWRSCVVCVKFIEKELECTQRVYVCVCMCMYARALVHMDERWVYYGWTGKLAVQDAGVVQGECAGWGGVVDGDRRRVGLKAR